jgi:hypothetical protein
LIGDRRTMGYTTEFAGHVTKRCDHAKLAKTRGQCGKGDGEARAIGPTMETKGSR